MSVNLSKTSHVLFFAVFLPIVSIAIGWLFNKLFPNLPFWMETVSPLFAYGLLYSWFEKSLWKIQVFTFLGIVSFPNLNGRWKGTQQSSHVGQDGSRVQIEACLEVTQTFSKICICAYYPRSQSESIVANFAEVKTSSYLFYTYDSEPNSLQEGTMQMHKGTVKLNYLPKEKKLIGLYFNSIGNHGEMNFDFEGYDLLFRLKA